MLLHNQTQIILEIENSFLKGEIFFMKENHTSFPSESWNLRNLLNTFLTKYVKSEMSHNHRKNRKVGKGMLCTNILMLIRDASNLL